MKLNGLKKNRIIFFLNILVYIVNLAYANNQIIQIYSQYQSIDMFTNTIFFKDNVIFKYNHVELFSKKIMVIPDRETQCLSMIKAYGNPVILKCFKKSEQHVLLAQSSIVSYNIVDDIITFIGNACIEQSGYFIQSDSIVYAINQRKIQAFSKKDSKTVTFLKLNSI